MILVKQIQTPLPVCNFCQNFIETSALQLAVTLAATQQAWYYARWKLL